jgi:hypothetical protein
MSTPRALQLPNHPAIGSLRLDEFAFERGEEQLYQGTVTGFPPGGQLVCTSAGVVDFG